MEYEILKGSMEDIKEIVELNRNIFTGMYENEPYSIDQYQSKLQDKNPIINIVKIDNKIIASSIAFQDEDSLYLWILAVSKDHRNKKIASQLLDHLEKSARDQERISVTTKVYSISKEMQQLIKQRSYAITKTDNNGAIHFKLNL